MRWVLGPIVTMLARGGETPGEPTAPELRDVEPEAYWDPEARELTVTPKAHDPEKEVTPHVAAVVVLPEGSELAGADAETIMLSSQPRTQTLLSLDPAGGQPTPVPLPGYDDSINNAVVLLYGYRV